MIKSLYSGVSGMKGFQTKLDVIGNNIANVNTVGYKKSTMNFQDLLSQNMGGGGVNPMQVGLGTTASTIKTVHTAGAPMMTGVPSDLAILGNGFFVVQEPAAAGAAPRQFLTRAGDFVADENGDLVTSQGYHVLDNTGARIRIDPTLYDSFTVNQGGQILGVIRATGAEQPTLPAGRTIGISLPPNPSGLRKFGNSMYEMTTNANPGGQIQIQAVTATNSKIASGMLEMSNVDLTEEFTEMIIAQRGFQANSRTISTSDEILQEVVNLKR